MASRRPVFGPAVNRDIFERRWLDKIKAAETKYQVPRSQSYTASEAIMRERAIVDQHRAIIQLGHFCEREARTLDIHLPTLEEVQSTPTAALNPLCVILAHRMCIEESIRIWQILKNGKTVPGGLSWQEHPLQLRRDINDVLDMVQKEKDSGYWVLDGQARRVVECLYAGYEQDRASRNVFGGKKGQAAGHQ